MNRQNVEERVEESVEESHSMKYDRRDKVCEICGKRVKAQGYGGHLFLVHDVKTGVVARLEEVQKRLDGLEKARNNQPASDGDGGPGSGPAVRIVGKNYQPFSSAVDELSGQLKSVQEENEELENRVAILEGFFGRIIGEKPGFLDGLVESDVTLKMSPKDWEKTEEERSTEESEEEEEEEEE